MTFRLEKSTASSSKTLVKFHVLDDSAAIVGTINVKPSEENDLRAHWKSAPQSSPKNAASVSKIQRYQRWSQPFGSRDLE